MSCFNPPPDQAITQLLNEALTEAKALNDKRAQSYALGHLGHLHEIAAAEKMAKAKAAQSAKDLWLLASQQTREALLLAQAISASDIAYKWQWQLGRILKAQSREKEAITVYEETVTTLKSVRNSLLGTNADIQFSFRDDAEPIYRELADLRLSATNPDLNKAIKTIDALQVAELENFFRCALGQFVEIDKVVAEEDPDAVIIYPIILRDRLEVILTLPGKRKEPVRYSPIKLEQDFVETKLQQLLDILASSSADSKESQSLSQEFYDLLIRPAEDSQYLQPGSKASLVFVLDGGLRNIPMSALWDSKKNQYLIEKYPIAVSPGLQLLGPKRLKPQQLTALVGGLIGDNKSSFTIAGQAYGFEPLKYVGDEISKVKSILPGSHDLSLQFNHEALRQQLTNQSFPIVHLSTHGYYSSDPKQTFIVMANNQIVQLDELQGILRAGKQNRTDAIELVVLSACETATGDRRATLGMAGAAIRSGAGSILATLWQVDDESTSYLIEEFYRNLKQVIEQRKGTKAEALQAAQLALLKNSENQQWQRPYYWSPFVLLGNWL